MLSLQGPTCDPEGRFPARCWPDFLVTGTSHPAAGPEPPCRGLAAGVRPASASLTSAGCSAWFCFLFRVEESHSRFPSSQGKAPSMSPPHPHPVGAGAYGIRRQKQDPDEDRGLLCRTWKTGPLLGQGFSQHHHCDLTAQNGGDSAVTHIASPLAPHRLGRWSPDRASSFFKEQRRRSDR